jgi:mRNA interferase HigB
VRVIKKRTLEEYWRAHPDAEKPLQGWHQLTEAAEWKSLAQVRQTFPTADVVGRLTVFNIKGNAYRLVVRIEYEFHLVFIRWFGTHAEYDKQAWQHDEWF